MTPVTGYGGACPPTRPAPAPVTGVAALAVALTGALVSLPSSAEQAPPAVGDKGAKSTWTEADKSGFGTAHPGEQRLVHAPARPGQRGLLPGPLDAERAQPPTRRHRRRLRRPQQRHDHPVLRPDDDSLRYTQVSLDRDGRYQVVGTS